MLTDWTLDIGDSLGFGHWTFSNMFGYSPQYVIVTEQSDFITRRGICCSKKLTKNKKKERGIQINKVGSINYSALIIAVPTKPVPSDN
jgi:hypothetical protein